MIQQNSGPLKENLLLQSASKPISMIHLGNPNGDPLIRLSADNPGVKIFKLHTMYSELTEKVVQNTNPVRAIRV